MSIGVEDFRDPGEQRLDRMLMQPFRHGTRDGPERRSDIGDPTRAPGPEK